MPRFLERGKGVFARGFDERCKKGTEIFQTKPALTWYLEFKT